jgi:hypothetical protein
MRFSILVFIGFVALAGCAAPNSTANKSSAMRTSGEPDLSRIPNNEQSMITRSCSPNKIMGPANYYACLRDQAAALSRSKGEPDLSRIPNNEQSMITRSCSPNKIMGPANYYACLRDQAASIGYNVDIKQK